MKAALAVEDGVPSGCKGFLGEDLGVSINWVSFSRGLGLLEKEFGV